MSADTAYKSNRLLKQRGVVINYTKKQVEEIIKCSTDVEYFVEKYIKVISLDEGIVDFKPYPFQRNLLNTFSTKRFTICKLPRQPLAIDTPILTTDGWKSMGEIQVGDKVYSPTGNPVSVIKKTDMMHNHDCYKIYFDNNEEIIADGDHRWKVSSSYWTKPEKVVTTEQIFEDYQRKHPHKRGKGVGGTYYINSTLPLQFEKKQLGIDPYLLGLWLGDGTKRNGNITAHIDDYKFYKTVIKENIPYEKVQKENSNCTYFRVEKLHTKLKTYNLICNKHIPVDYLRSSYEDRMELLRGLMDTDGYVVPNSRKYEFYQKDYDFMLQVVELLATLGIKSKIRYKLIKGNRYHTISFTTSEQVFKLPRKLERTQTNEFVRPQNTRHYIQKIEKVDSVPVACITVDSDDHLFLCGKTCIPTHNSGKTVSVGAFLVHQAIFNDNFNIAVLANKRETAYELMAKIQVSYENLPKWLQQGIVAWNKGSIELENGSRITASATSSGAVRGFSYNIVFLDEFAHVATNIAEEFFTSVYPTITSGKTTKVIIVSTPKGMNHYFKLWTDATKGRNSYVPLEAHWSEVPGRDEKWKEETIKNTSLQQFNQEFSCDFLGSIGTLINPAKLKALVYEEPILSSGGLDIYEHPIPDHEYLMTVDVSRGMELDHSAFILVDISEYPHRIVGKYRSNTIKPMLFPDVIVPVLKKYNNAWVLVEINDIGDQVASIIYYDMEYPNLLMTSMRGRAGQVLGGGFSGGKTQLGLKMARAPKKLGCSNLKQLIESDKIIFTDFQIITELTTFIEKRGGFEAEEGCNDDLVSCMILYAWTVVQDYFREMTSDDVRKQLYEFDKESLEEDLAPFGFINTGLEEEIIIGEDGLVWNKAEEIDEYGTTLSNWEFTGQNRDDNYGGNPNWWTI